MPDTGQSQRGYHRLETFNTCKRKFAYRYIMGLIPYITPKPLAQGTCVHAALAAHYEGRSYKEGLDEVDERCAYMLPKAKAIVEAYLAEYVHERLDVVFVEKEFLATLRGYVFTRRIDMGVRENGELWVYDHKCAWDAKKRLAYTRWDAPLFTQDFICRYLSERETGLRFGGVVLNLLGTSEPYQFQRVPLRWSPALMRDVMESIYWASREAEEALERYQDPWRFPQSWACQGRYSTCAYLPLCQHGKDEVVNFAREEV